MVGVVSAASAIGLRMENGAYAPAMKRGSGPGGCGTGEV